MRRRQKRGKIRIMRDGFDHHEQVARMIEQMAVAVQFPLGEGNARRH